MQGPLVYLVAYVFMVNRILDFLRVKNNGGHVRHRVSNCIDRSSCTSDSYRNMGRV